MKKEIKIGNMFIKRGIFFATSIMLLSIGSISIPFAKAEAAKDVTGDCSAEDSNVTYTISDSNADGVLDTLTLSGTGASKKCYSPYGGMGILENNDESTFAPWHNYKKNIETVRVNKGIKEIGAASFCDMPKLKNVYLDDEIETIAGGVFCNCTGLEEIVLPAHLKILAGATFRNCSSLKTVDSSQCDSLEYIGMNGTMAGNTFEGCSSLETLEIPNTVKTLGYLTFKDCTSLKYLVIPNSVETIYPEIFKGCTKLESVTLNVGKDTNVDGPYGFGIDYDETAVKFYILSDDLSNNLYTEVIIAAKELVFESKEAEDAFFKNHDRPQYAKVSVQAHDWELDLLVKPTCSKVGSAKGKRCKDCKEYIAFASPEAVPMVAHQLKTEPAVVATCENAGKTERIACSVCGYEKVAAQSVAPLGHTFDNGKITKQSSKKKNGQVTYQCKVCQKAISVKVSYKENPSKVKKNLVLDKNGNIYRITDKKKRKVTFVRCKYGAAGTVKIANSIKVKGKSYKVTKIGRNAFQYGEKVTKIDVASKISAIGKNAFKNAKALTTLTLRSKKMTSKSLEKGSMNGITSSVKLVVNAKKQKAYKKLFRKKGMK